MLLGTPWRRLGAALAAAVAASVIVTCGPGDAETTTGAPAAGSTLTGNYLAARYARSEGAENDAARFLLAALEKSPKDPVLLGRTYVALVLDGRVAEGIDIARRYMEVDPSIALTQIVVSVGDIHAGKFDAAAKRLAQLPSGPFNPIVAPMLRAWVEEGRGDTKAALQQLEPLKGPGSQLGVLYDVHAAWLADVAGDHAAALSHVESALAAQSEAWLRLTELGGEIYERAGQPDDARQVYEKFVKQHPDSQVITPLLARLDQGKKPPREIASARDGAAEALFDAAGIFSRQQNREPALLFGQLGLYLRPAFPELQLLVGDLMEGADRYADAIRLYQAVDPHDPLAPTARIGVARNLERMDRFDEAEKILRAQAAERPNDPDPLSELGDMLRKREHFAEAAKVYDEAIARMGTLDKRDWRLLYVRGIALERSKQWARAEQDFLKALEFEPEQPYVLNYLGYSWVEQGVNFDRAEAMIRRAVELRPEDGYIVDSLGWVLFRLGHHEEAVVQLERAVELRPEDAVINDHVGDAYWAVGRQREARFQWRAALASDPDPELKAALEKKIERGPVREANAVGQ